MRHNQDPGAEAPARAILRTHAGAGREETAKAQTDPWPEGDDDTHLDYYDTPAGCPRRLPAVDPCQVRAIGAVMPIRLTADARKLVFLLALLSLQRPDPAAELLDALGSTRSWCVSARPARPKAAR
jgi:hypothetical protein